MEKQAWNGIAVIKNFLDNKKVDNYKEIVAKIISTFHAMKINILLKIHFLHLNFFHQI
ncbi:hypothetical protein ALC62_15978 [Cyphomyrmex costatus]|uniref:Uncharacterized protein n=1 Tax=Cyphomyrmex costatus TaxID=456900 RepID=A0A151I6U9_9HYME|nr:hypothetical protein ALC62_15978 [Cyphomyrmex costatus]